MPEPVSEEGNFPARGDKAIRSFVIHDSRNDACSITVLVSPAIKNYTRAS